MKDKAILFTLIISYSYVHDLIAQPELIPNWNIENPASNGYPNPPCNDGNEVYRAEPWGGATIVSNGALSGPRLFDTRGSVINGTDYCPGQGPVPASAPTNSWGSQSPHSGNRYFGIACGQFYTERQYIFVPLNEPVYYGDELELSLFVSKADNMESLGFQVRLSGDSDWEPSDPTIYSGTANNPSTWVEHTSTITVSEPAEDEGVENNGLDLGEMIRLQMQKIEELTLYILQLEEEMEALKVGQK